MDDMKQILTMLSVAVSATAKSAVESFFMCDAEIREPWIVEERLSGEYDHIITLGCSNSDFQGVIMIALNDDNIELLIDDRNELIDIFGEMANTYCGMLMDEDGVVDVFGVLSQAVPMYAAKRAFFPRAWAISGRVYNENGGWIQVGFAIRSFMMMLNR